MLSEEDFKYLDNFKSPKVKYKKLEELLGKRIEDRLLDFKRRWIQDKLDELRIKDWRSMKAWEPIKK